MKAKGATDSLPVGLPAGLPAGLSGGDLTNSLPTQGITSALPTKGLGLEDEMYVNIVGHHRKITGSHKLEATMID